MIFSPSLQPLSVTQYALPGRRLPFDRNSDMFWGAKIYFQPNGVPLNYQELPGKNFDGLDEANLIVDWLILLFVIL